MKTLVGIITYNRLNYLKTCADSARKALRRLGSVGKSDPSSRVVIFDDVSSDGTIDWLKKSDFKFILGQDRGGVAKNSNRAIKYARDYNFDVLFLVNDDIEIKPEALETYVNAIEVTDYEHFCYTDPLSQFKPSEYFTNNGIELVRRVTGDGAFMTITKDMIAELGGFDVEYGMFGSEHYDYSRRAAAVGFANDSLDVVAATNLVNVRQYKEIIPKSIEKFSEHMKKGFETWVTQRSQPPVIFKPIII